MTLKKNWKKVFSAVAIISAIAFAEVFPETEGMQDTRGDGTFLTGSPTFVYDRPSQMGGLHSESEEWTPEKLRYRLFVNRVSETPSWTPHAPSIWISVGNEVGDLMYQDARVGGWTKDASNRTPMLEAGFRSKSYDGFWTTARFFQVDHYAQNSVMARSKMVGTTSYALFGENLPFFSTGYAGLGYTGSFFETVLLAGREYLWEMGESGRWISVEYKPRAELRLDAKYLHATFAVENAEYVLLKDKEVGNRKELNGSVKIGEDSLAQKGKKWNVALGVAFRAVDDSGAVPFRIKDDYVVFPFLEVSLRPTKRLSFAGFVGTSGREFAGKDSVNLAFPEFANLKTNVGFKNHVASTLNPLGADYEYVDDDTIRLRTDGFMQLHRVYLDLLERTRYFGLGMNIAGWFEKGAETFEVEKFKKDKTTSVPYRTGDVDRIDSWIRGISGEVSAELYYEKMFIFSARAGFERIDGEEKRFEVNPVEEWISIQADWNLWNHLFVNHAWTYRSDAQWNLRTENPYVVKGSWYWNASLTQKFPEYGLSLTATLLHSLGKNLVQMPNGGEDATRFYCNITKSF